jgi:hypothetical protein
MKKKKQHDASSSIHEENAHDVHTFSKKSLALTESEDVVIAPTSKEERVSEKKESPRKQNTATPQQVQAEKIDRELNQIYKNDDGSLPDMKTFQKRPRGQRLRAMLTFVFSLCVLSGAVWYGCNAYQSSRSGFAEDDVILSIGGEESVVFGQEVRYRVRFKNAQSVLLSDATIEVRYPAGFVFATSSMTPDPETNNVWTLGELGQSDGEFIDISGHLYGNSGEAQSFRVFLNYMPSNFSSTFQKVATQETTISSGPFDITLQGPESIAQGVAVPFDITLTPRNLPEVLIPDHMALVFDSSVPFVVKTMEPESAESAERTWLFDSLAEETVFHITGAFAGDTSPVTTHATLLGWREGQTRSDAYTIGVAEVSPTLADSRVSVQLVANGSGQDITVQPGELVNATIAIKNTTSDTLSDVRVRFVIDAPSADERSIMYWQGIEDVANGTIVGEQLSESVRRGEITWDAETISALKQLDPNETVTIDVSLPVKTAEQTDLALYTSSDIILTSDVQYMSNNAPETSASIPLTLSLNSDTTFEVRDEVDGDTHTVTWLLSNSFHPLRDIEAKVSFYGDVSFDTDDVIVSAGEVSYNEQSHELVWKVPQMPLFRDIFDLQFPVTLNKKNPSQTQLTSKVTVTAIDTVTNKQILLVGREVGL